MDLSIRRAHEAFGQSDSNVEDYEVSTAPIQRVIGAPINRKASPANGDTADLLGKVSCDWVDYKAIHLGRRENKDTLKRRELIHVILSLYVLEICIPKFIRNYETIIRFRMEWVKKPYPTRRIISGRI